MKRIAAAVTVFVLASNYFLCSTLAGTPDVPVSVDTQKVQAIYENAQETIEESQTAGQAADQTENRPEEQTAGQRVDQTADQTAGQRVDQTAGQTADQTVGQTAGQAVDQAEGSAAGQEAGRGPQVAAPCALLMEASTGTVIYEKNADEPRNPASVTKIMTLILIFDAIQSGKIKLTDQVVTSAYAKSMGGSQVFLEEGEVQTVETLIKCIVIASGNDASVAMAEYISGDEGSFVQMMNERAAGLGMKNTHFEDCCGLTDSQAHVTTARDIALMSRELITKYPEIFNYSTIWMENITHVTKQGTKEFGLSNTNKLLKMATNFEVTGLKTGSTSIAKYCLSATARKDGVQLIAAIMAAPDYKVRFADAVTLLNYGYANCKLYVDQEPIALPPMPVSGGVEETVPLRYEGTFSYLSLKGEDFSEVKKELVLEETLEAPVEPGQKAGVLRYTLGGGVLGEIPVVTDGSVKKAGFIDYWKKVFKAAML